MIPGFEKVVEQRIQAAQRNGEFDNLPNAGKPLVFENDGNMPEDLRLAHKILKNSGFVPQEVELKNKIRQTEDLLAGMEEAPEKYRLLKKLNFLIMKVNSMRNTSIMFDLPQHYTEKLEKRLDKIF